MTTKDKPLPSLPNGLKVKEVWLAGMGEKILLAKKGDSVYLFTWDGVSTTYNSVVTYIKLKE